MSDEEEKYGRDPQELQFSFYALPLQRRDRRPCPWNAMEQNRRARLSVACFASRALSRTSPCRLPCRPNDQPAGPLCLMAGARCVVARQSASRSGQDLAYQPRSSASLRGALITIDRSPSVCCGSPTTIFDDLACQHHAIIGDGSFGFARTGPL